MYVWKPLVSLPTSSITLIYLLAPRSEATNALRRRIKSEIEDQIMDFFLVQGGQVVLYDANNGNVKARKETLVKFESQGVHVIFLGQFAVNLFLYTTPDD
jgi:hypothetical protein